jgi:hypothetical protein
VLPCSGQTPHGTPQTWPGTAAIRARLGGDAATLSRRLGQPETGVPPVLVDVDAQRRVSNNTVARHQNDDYPRIGYLCKSCSWSPRS